MPAPRSDRSAPSPIGRPGRRPPLRPTEWGHVVSALLLTLMALASWSYVARGPDGVRPMSPEEAQRILSERVERHKARPRTFSIAATGDVLIHAPVAARAARNSGGRGYDFRPMFGVVAPLIEGADLAICHMETPISRDNSDVSSYPSFNAPREIAIALRHAGYDLCSTASNHSYDQGAEGIRETLSVLRQAGVATEGTAVNERAARLPVVIDVNGVKLAQLSYTYGLNGLTLPEGQDHLVNLIDKHRMLRDARRAKKDGAEFVVVSVHWGQEFQAEPTKEQLDGARRLLESKNIDLLIGHHAHVPQPIQRVGREFAILGLGNFLSNQRPGATSTCCLPETQDGLLVRADIKETEKGWATKISYWPTWVRPGTYDILPVAAALNDPAFESLHDDLRASWRRTVTSVGMLRAGEPHVRPGETP